MTIETWKEEFYSIPAEQMENKSWKECIEHSIKKFRGLYKKNLKKHGVKLDSTFMRVYDNTYLNSISITALSCALCVKARHCTQCAFIHILPSLENLDREHCSCEYNIFVNTHNPAPMIRTLLRIMDTMKTIGLIDKSDPQKGKEINSGIH